MTEKDRCPWAGTDPIYRAYHDEEWGRPVVDDHRLFEKICLEGFQSGLSWLTILRKRENFRRAFDGFDFARIARYTEADVDRLLTDTGIVRHRGKILATINNAGRALALRDEFGSLAAFFWRFEPEVEARPTEFSWQTLSRLAETPASRALSKDLKKRGWRFVGPTTCYAFMQAMGLVNDHVETCHCRAPLLAARARLVLPVPAKPV
ncbi:MAG: DNA-3-methyladenine glycosylase I [Alphaproteobacteria bacterium]|nr:DNA-3-methyladenine glycosylase I [Alphaproteobacteria bacterium]